MAQIPVLTKLSYSSRSGWLVHGEQRIVCIILGALNDVLSRMSASWADSKDRRPTAVLSSVQQLARAVSIILSVKTGAPRRCASSGARELNPGVDPRQIISDFEAL